jgi:hypothetical protein
MYESEGWLLACRYSAYRLFVGVDQSVPATEEVVMLQRVYFVTPDVPLAPGVVDELQAAGIERVQMDAWLAVILSL